MTRWLIGLFLLLSPAGAIRADDAKVALTLAAPFSDRAVLQRDMPAPVWGTAAAGATVRVSFAGQSQSAVTGEDGRWRVVLDPMKAGATGTLVVEAETKLVVDDVLVGDVWLCAGDAFMSKPIAGVRAARGELARKTYPAVRLFRSNSIAAKQPPAETAGGGPSGWQIPDRSNIEDFSALAYLFAVEMQAATGAPVGVVVATDPTPVSIQRGGKVAGATVEAWISEATLRATPEAAPIFEYYRSALPLREALAEYENALGDWKLKTGKAFGAELRELEKREPDVWYDYVTEMRKAGKPAPTDPPRKPTAESLRNASTRPARMHEATIAPIAGLAMRGAALNLGLGNAARATQCRSLLAALMLDWRNAWRRDDLPFVLLQQGRAAHPNMDPRALAELRAAQAAAADATHAALAPTIDLQGGVFPDDVPTLARRLAASARVAARIAPTTAGPTTTGPTTTVTAATGPAIEKVTFEGDKAIVQFRAGTAGLAVRGGGALNGFALTERPNRWAYADATIDGQRVIVRHPKLAAPVALRYDWVVEPGHEGNLVDASGLPAAPYRSDDWPAFTDTPAARKPNAVATIQPADLYPVEDPSLPRVLLIGDSIMNGYSPTVIHELKGKVNVVRLVAFGMIGGNDASAATFCAKLKDGDYALIHYNDGLHSLPPRITDEQFGIGLTAMLKQLKTTAPRVLWATTTPAPDRNNTLGPESHNGTVVARNAMSKKIAADLGVPVVDLYDLVIADRERLQGFANLHFTPEGSQRMGKRIAASILESLGAK